MDARLVHAALERKGKHVDLELLVKLEVPELVRIHQWAVTRSDHTPPLVGILMALTLAVDKLVTLEREIYRLETVVGLLIDQRAEEVSDDVH